MLVVICNNADYVFCIVTWLQLIWFSSISHVIGWRAADLSVEGDDRPCYYNTLICVQESNVSKAVKTIVTLSTLILCSLIVIYHAIEVQVRAYILAHMLQAVIISLWT